MSEFSYPREDNRQEGRGGREENTTDQWTLNPRGEDDGGEQPEINTIERIRCEQPGINTIERIRDEGEREDTGHQLQRTQEQIPANGVAFQDKTSVLSEKESYTTGLQQPAHPARQSNQGTAWSDDRHPQIVAMMAPYLAKFGDNVFVGELLDAIGKQVADLPVPKGTRFASKDGTKGYLCWNAVLGRCKFER